jgi:hypothetical protein
MKTTTFALLAAATAAIAAGAYFATQQRATLIAPSFERQALYPGLLARLNDVTMLRVATQADGVLTMARDGAEWRLAEKHGYFADFDKISQTLVELASMETLEPKTQKPENFAGLNVEAVEAPAGTVTNSIHVTAKAGDEILADLLVGRARPTDVGGGVFVRRQGDNQVWLASGAYQPKRKALQWLDRNIVNIDSRRIARATMQHADGDGFVVAKPDIASEDMAFASFVPEGREPKPAHELNNIAAITDFLVLEDVRPGADLDWSSPAAILWLETYDGVKIAVTAVKDGKDTWFRLLLEPVAADPRLEAFVAEHKGKDSAQGRLADQLLTADAAAAEIARLNARLGPWAYRFTDFKTGKATMRAADLLQEVGKAQQ